MSGILTMSATDYHADKIAATPTLSASIANILLNQSPAHAWVAHPKLNPNYERTHEDKFSIGTVVHSIILEGVDVVQVVEANDWRTNAAKEERDAAIAAGRVPLLAKDMARVQEMITAVYRQLADIEVAPPLLVDGKPEQTLVWDEDGVTCRSRCDWLRDDLTAIDDLKTTSRSANPEQWSRTLFSIGADVQAAFYLRGLRAVTGQDAEFRFIVAETYAPYALSVVSLGPDVLTLADEKVNYALRLWKDCLAADEWPSYPRKVCRAQLPAWAETQWFANEDHYQEEVTA